MVLCRNTVVFQVCEITIVTSRIGEWTVTMTRCVSLTGLFY